VRRAAGPRVARVARGRLKASTNSGGSLGPCLAAADSVTQDAKRFVYVLHSLANPDRQFVESAANVSMRVASHNAGHSPLTAAHRPWKLVAVVQFGNEAMAQRFEKFLKSGAGRAFSKVHFT
jgi:predicted GIY-YIG superfamily endonuclease